MPFVIFVQQEIKNGTIMKTFEYTISSDAVAKDGMVSVSSICGYIVNAAHRAMMDEGYPGCMLSRCTFEIDERPREGEDINIIVNSGLNNIVTLLNRSVSITDNEGHEIGRASIEWLMPDAGRRGLVPANPSRVTRRFINKFHGIFPDIEGSAGLQLRIDMDFKDGAKDCNDFSVALKKICDSQYFFLARSGAETLCRAMLQTA